MKRAYKFVAQLAVVAFMLFTGTQQASALVQQGNIVYTGSEAIFGTGFGTLNNLLVLQGQGSATIETGSVAPGTPKDILSGDATNQSEAYSFQELINLGITSAANLRLGFNVNETGNTESTLNLLSFMLQVYDANGVVASTLGLNLTANPAGNEFDASEQQGQGKGAYLFVLDQDAIDLLDPYFLSPSGYFLGAYGSIDNINNGPDGWYLAQGTGAPVPEPGTIVLLGLGFFGLAVYGKRRIRVV